MDFSAQTEICVLVLAAALGIVQLLVATGLVTKDRGVAWNLSARDRTDLAPALSPLAARAQRAFENFKETFPLFVAAVMAVQFLQANSDISSIGAWIYLSARVLYVPLYLSGVPVVRTLVWLTSMVGIVMILSSVWMF